MTSAILGTEMKRRFFSVFWQRVIEVVEGARLRMLGFSVCDAR